MQERREPIYQAFFLALLISIFTLMIFTGCLLSFKYIPTVEGAYQSVSNMKNSLFWNHVSGVHYFASGLGILIGYVFLISSLFYGGTKWENRHVFWSGILLVLIFYVGQISGNLLPLSQHDARTAIAEAEIASGLPIVGHTVYEQMLVGDRVSDSTLTRWYQLHGWGTFLFGVLLLAFALRSLKNRITLKIIFGSVFFAIPISLILSMFFHGAPLGDPAAEYDLTSSNAQPMWYVLPAHASLMIFENINPGLGWIGAIVLPSVFMLFLMSIPFFAKRREKLTLIFSKLVSLIIVLCLVLMWASYGKSVQNPFREKTLETFEKQLRTSSPIDEDLMQKGRQVFIDADCMMCHKVGDEGDENLGPNLGSIGDKYAEPDWYIEMLPDPPSKGLHRMPSFDDLSPENLRAIAEYLRSLKSVQ